MKKARRNFYVAVSLLIGFALWTVAVRLVDVQHIGPLDSPVGFATLNRYVHQLTGVHMWLYTITDWLSLIPIICILGFGLLGLTQWIRRKHLKQVDTSILILGGFYIVVMAVYVLFEYWIVNYRPVLILGVLEASYPSSTTMLVMCVMPTTILQLRSHIQNTRFQRWLTFVISAFTLFMVVLRFLSGVHWFTDIIGGALLSASLVMLYYSICRRIAT